MRQSELFENIYISTLANGHKEVFRNDKYLFNIINSQSDIFDEDDYFTVFYDKSLGDNRFGILNRKLEVVIPQVLEYARIVFNNQILYRLEGQYGVWNDNLSNIIPPHYDCIECVEKFYLVAKGGGFPNSFWNNCGGRSWGNICAEPSKSFIYQQNGDLAWNDGFDNIYPSFKHVIDLKGIHHDSQIGICYHIQDKRISYGIINCDGRYIVPPTYDYLKIIEEEEDPLRKYEPKIAVFGVLGETKMDIVHRVNKYIHSGGQYGLLTLDNNVIIPAIYDGISVYGDFVRVRKGNLFGLYNINGDILLDTVYAAINFVEVDRRTQMIVFNIGGVLEGDINETDKYYSFGVKGFRPTPFSSNWHPRWEDIHLKINGGMWGYYNLVTKKKSERMYPEVSPFNKGHTCVKVDDKYYLLDLNFQIIEGPFSSRSDANSYLDYY